MKLNRRERENYNTFLPIDHHDNAELHEKVEASKDTLFLEMEELIHYKDCTHLNKEVVEESLTWMKKIKIKVLDSKKDSLKKLISKLKEECAELPRVVGDSGRPVLGIDTETTSLNVKFLLEGGGLEKGVNLVDVVIGTTNKKGYLIPFDHNETDGVSNYKEEDLREFLQALVDNFHLVYFNAVYDMSILTQFGVEVDYRHYSDIMIMRDALGFDTFDDLRNRHNLKFYSEYFLGRKMLTIEELMGSKFIALKRLSATTTSVYACIDAINTLSLFNYLNKEFEPYKTQKHIIDLDHEVLYHHIGMFNHGLPLNQIDEVLEKNLLTVIHRINLVERTFYKISGSVNYKISTPEKINYFIAELVLEGLGFTLDFELFKEGHPKGELIDNYLDRIVEDCGIILKVDENKSRGKFIKAETLKERGKGVEVLNVTKKTMLESEYWKLKLKKRVRRDILKVCKIVNIYRVLQLELTRLGKMYRYAVADDRGYPVAMVGLRVNGTDTRRFKNASGDGSHRFIIGAREVKVYLGNGLCGINAQGLPSTLYSSLKPSESEQRDPIQVEVRDKGIMRWMKQSHLKSREILKELLLTKFNQKK